MLRECVFRKGVLAFSQAIGSQVIRNGPNFAYQSRNQNEEGSKDTLREKTNNMRPWSPERIEKSVNSTLSHSLGLWRTVLDRSVLFVSNNTRGRRWKAYRTSGITL